MCSVTLANLAEIEKKVGRRTETERKIVAIGTIEIVIEIGATEQTEGTAENETGVSVIVAMIEKGKPLWHTVFEIASTMSDFLRAELVVVCVSPECRFIVALNQTEDEAGNKCKEKISFFS